MTARALGLAGIVVGLLLMRFCRQLGRIAYEHDRAQHDFWVKVAPPRARTLVSFIENRPGEGPGHEWLRAYIAWCAGFVIALIGLVAALGAFDG